MPIQPVRQISSISAEMPPCPPITLVTKSVGELMNTKTFLKSGFETVDPSQHAPNQHGAGTPFTVSQAFRP